MFKQIKTFIFVSILKTFAHLPFAALPVFGWILGWLNYLLSKKTAQNLQTNLRASKLFNNEVEYKKILNANIQSNGIGLLETLHIWRKPYQKTLQLVQGCSGWDAVELALQQKKGIIFLTPHLGCFEITSLYYAQFAPITVMFRPPRQTWLLPLIMQGRQRGKATLAPANMQGIKQLLEALKRGEAIGILPDQAPLAGEGEWAPFFGRDADTMTLASKLANKTGAAVFMAFGERLSGARGYYVHIKPLPEGAIATPALLNAQIEKQIAQCPSQYLWGYNRYKNRR
jgi:Kdo2-lipid IVA lauroyltransferase/acyltransferase